MSDYNKNRRQRQLEDDWLGKTGYPPEKPWGQGFFWWLVKGAVLFPFRRPLLFIGVTGLIVIACYHFNMQQQNRPSRVTPSQLEQGQ